ncbi:hypothetical protein C8F01DRAFT_1213474 [Mycena amicta]|nr:hypothetical protein C8F01DRAFT_1213474 [Mycena amicta]
MSISVARLIWMLDLFFPPEMAMEQALYIIALLFSIYPLLRLHLNQREEAYRGAPLTGWLKSVRTLIYTAFTDDTFDELRPISTETAAAYADYVSNDLSLLCGYMGLDAHDGTRHRNRIPSLRRRYQGKDQQVWLLTPYFKWIRVHLTVATCSKCHADFYPDRITIRGNGRQRSEILECDTEFIRVSKSGVWVHREIARSQERSFRRFHSGWSNFASWLNDTTHGTGVKFTNRQSQRLFLEHFARRLLVSHGKQASFLLPAHGTAQALSNAIRNELGADGGIIPKSVKHGCQDCTHVKRYASTVVAVSNSSTEVVGSEAGPVELNAETENPLPENLPDQIVHQAEPPAGSPRGYVRVMVMDGKTITHKICAMEDCKNPLVNYKNGRFCTQHLHHRNKCGITTCGRPVYSQDALTCDDETHKAWYKKFDARFHRLDFPGVQRVIRKQREMAERIGPHGNAPSLNVELPALGDIPGVEVSNTFRARTTYCLETAQWACGFPIGWGKCYKSEGDTQVLAFLNRLWQDYLDSRPSFIVYDKACDILRHIVTQNPNDDWLRTTKFIVDAWHYIGHRASDVLCRTRCNPAPMDGSQPDLVLTKTDADGVVHQTRAFNTETAEQLNSWLNGFENQLKQMTDANYDFFVHVLMMVYSEMVEERIAEKHRRLPDNFWDQVNGLVDISDD